MSITVNLLLSLIKTVFNFFQTLRKDLDNSQVKVESDVVQNVEKKLDTDKIIDSIFNHALDEHERRLEALPADHSGDFLGTNNCEPTSEDEDKNEEVHKFIYGYFAKRQNDDMTQDSLEDYCEDKSDATQNDLSEGSPNDNVTTITDILDDFLGDIENGKGKCEEALQNPAEKENQEEEAKICEDSRREERTLQISTFREKTSLLTPTTL